MKNKNIFKFFSRVLLELKHPLSYSRRRYTPASHSPRMLPSGAPVDFHAELKALQSDLRSATTHFQIFFFRWCLKALWLAIVGVTLIKSQVSLGCVQPIG